MTWIVCNCSSRGQRTRVQQQSLQRHRRLSVCQWSGSGLGYGSSGSVSSPRTVPISFRVRACASNTGEPPEQDHNHGAGADANTPDSSRRRRRRSQRRHAGYEAHVRERLRDWRAFRMQLLRRELECGDAFGTVETEGSAPAESPENAATENRASKAGELLDPSSSTGDALHASPQRVQETPRMNSMEWTGADIDMRWVHPVTAIETGNILVASPKHFLNEQQYFAQTVILILEHGSDGTTGVIMNRRAAQRISFVSSLAGTDLGRVFGREALYLGGPVGLDSLLVLHDESSLLASNDRQQLPGSAADEVAYEIVPGGVYCGGLGRLTELARRGSLARPDRVRFFCGYCGWEPGQLEREVHQGVWYVASASAELILGPRVPPPPFVAESPERDLDASTSAGKSTAWRERSRFSWNISKRLGEYRAQAVSQGAEGPVALWREVVDKLAIYRRFIEGFPHTSDS